MEFLSTFNQPSDWALLALRVAVAVIFFAHGGEKWALLSPSAIKGPQTAPRTMARALSFGEPVAAAMLLIGFAAQPAALFLAAIMAGAIFVKIGKWHVPFVTQHRTGWEFDFLIFAATIAIVVAGPGAMSFDALFP